MDTLIKMALIKSAKFDYAEVNLDANSLFIGANGAGKTTLLRAILYFYTADGRTLGISSAKKTSFSDYYFDEEHSYIVYMYKKQDKFILVVLHKNSSIRFRFCLLDSVPDIKKIFVQNSRAVEPATLWAELRKIGNLSPTLNASQYRQTLYSKSSKLKYFSLFEAKDYDGFVKTLSNIFVNSKVDSGAIKKVIVSSLNVEKSIDIERIKRYLSEFNDTYQDIVSYEKSAKNREKLLKFLTEYEYKKVDIKENLSTLAFSKKEVEKKIETLNEKNEKLSSSKTSLEEKVRYENSLFDKRKTRLNEEIGGLKSEIKKAKELKEFYKNEKIQEKIDAYSSLALKKSGLELLKSKYDFLTKEHQEIEQSHKQRVETIQNSFQNRLNSINSKKIELQKSIYEEQNILKDKQRDELEKIDDEYKKEEDFQRLKKENLGLELRDKKYELQSIKKEVFIYKDRELLNKKLIKDKDIVREISRLNSELNTLNERLDREKRVSEADIKGVLEKETFELEVLHKKEQTLKNLLSPKNSSVIKNIYDNNLNVDKYIYFLKEEILESEIDVQLYEKSSKIFELDFFDVDIPKSELGDKLTSIKLKKESLKKQYKLKKDNIQRVFKNLENSTYRDKKELNEQIKSICKEQMKIKSDITKLKNIDIEESERFRKNSLIKIENITSTILILQESIENLEESLESLKKEKQNKKTAKKSNVTKLLNELQEEFEKAEKEFTQEKISQNTAKEKELNEQNRSYYEVLKEKKVDTEELKKVLSEIAKLSLHVEQIENYKVIITNYNTAKLDYIGRIKPNESNLNELNKKLQNLTDIYNVETASLGRTIKEYIDKVDKNKIGINSYGEAMVRVKEFENGAIMRECLEVVKEYKANETYENLDSIIASLGNLNSQYRELEKSISSLVGRLNEIYNNSLNIKRDFNSIKSAYHLKSFSQDNKIEHYKDLQSQSLNQIIKSSTEEYDNLMLYSGKIEILVKKITKLFSEIKIGVIDDLTLRYSRTNNKVIEQLQAVKQLSEDNPNGYGISLFNDTNNSKEMIKLLKQLRDTIEYDNLDSIELEDSFVLEFKVVENGNDSRYQTSLDNIGSNGTDVLVKSMIYIAMLHIFKSKSTKKELAVNVILDEIGILSQRYLKELIEFANKYGIYFINGAPDEKLIGTYKRVSLIQNINNRSIVQELISK